MSERGLAKSHPSFWVVSCLDRALVVQPSLNLVFAVTAFTSKTMAAVRPLAVRGTPELRVIVWVGGCVVCRLSLSSSLGCHGASLLDAFVSTPMSLFRNERLSC